jgi:RHS repeat-associated protein
LTAELHADDALYAAGARAYQPSLGVFSGLDSRTGGAADPRTMNRYLYALANPATLVDPDGHLAQAFVTSGGCGPDGSGCPTTTGGSASKTPSGTTSAGTPAVNQTGGPDERVTKTTSTSGVSLGMSQAAFEDYVCRADWGRPCNSQDPGELQAAFEVALLACGTNQAAPDCLFLQGRQDPNCRSLPCQRVGADVVAALDPSGAIGSLLAGIDCANGDATGCAAAGLILVPFAGRLGILREGGELAGLVRTLRFGSNWPSASLSEAIATVAGNNPNVASTLGKVIYENPETGLQVVHDLGGNYFRVRNPGLAGVSQYLDLTGGKIPANVPILRSSGGYVYSGVPRDVRQALTHFLNSD